MLTAYVVYLFDNHVQKRTAGSNTAGRTDILPFASLPNCYKQGQQRPNLSPRSHCKFIELKTKKKKKIVAYSSLVTGISKTFR